MDHLFFALVCSVFSIQYSVFSIAMDKALATAENLFARALELAPDARNEFLVAHCGQDLGLRREVESLLGAHERAGDFLRESAQRQQTNRNRPASASRQGTAIMNAADYAEAFLCEAARGGEARPEPYVASLPESVRREAQERIQAGLRVRQMRA